MAAILALHEARGDVGRAQAMMSKARPEAEGRSGIRQSEETSPGERARVQVGGLAALVDEEEGLTQEVLGARLAAAELDTPGPRLPRDARALEVQRPSRSDPPSGARDNPRWHEYVAYYEKRLGELKEGKDVEGPLRWEGYEQLRGWFSRGLLFEGVMVKRLRTDAELPQAQRRWLGEFEKPRIERAVGVSKPSLGLRFADVLVIEEGERTGRALRVETFSFKSRNLAPLERDALRTQMREDAREASRNYGETLDIRRPSLRRLVGASGAVSVSRVRLIYEGGRLKPTKVPNLKTVIDEVREAFPDVEVSFE